MSETDFEEKKYLLENVVQISVLTHADAFSRYSVQQLLKTIEEGELFAEQDLAQLYQESGEGTRETDGKVHVSTTIVEAWQKIKEEGWFGLNAPPEYEGLNLPDTVSVAIQEAFATEYPSAYFFVLSTVEVAKLVERQGQFPGKDDVCQKLYSGEWSGAFSLAESVFGNDHSGLKTVARHQDETYIIEGIKDFVAPMNHNLTDGHVHIVLAAIAGEGSQPQKTGLFAVPSQRREGDQVVDNDIRVLSVHAMAGIKDVPFCLVEYGKENRCRGYLLTDPEDDVLSVANALEGFRLQLVLQNVSQVNQVGQYITEIMQQHGSLFGKLADTIDPEISISELPHIVESVLLTKMLKEGIRGALYQAAFFNDCRNHGAEQQKAYFADLATVYIQTLKVYASRTASSLIRDIEIVLGGFGCQLDTKLNLAARDAQLTAIIGGSNELIASDIVFQILFQEDGRCFQQLIKHFQDLDSHLATSGPLREAIGIWKDYIGGLIVLLDDLKVEDKENSLDTYSQFASQIVMLLGDVIVCYHLIRQGLEAEKILLAEAVNFYNLKNECAKKPELKKWYNKLVYAEYFALYRLSLQESTIHLIQRKPTSVADYLSTSES